MLCAIGLGLGLLSQPASWRAGTARSYTPRACIRVEKPPPSGLCESARTATAPEQARSGRLASGQRPAGCASCWPGAAAAGASCARRREWQDGGATLRPVELLPGHAAALMELAGVEVGLGGRGGAHGGGEDEDGVCQAVPSLVAALVGEAGLRRLRRAQDGPCAQVPAREARRLRRARRPVGSSRGGDGLRYPCP